MWFTGMSLYSVYGTSIIRQPSKCNLFLVVPLRPVTSFTYVGDTENFTNFSTFVWVTNRLIDWLYTDWLTEGRTADLVNPPTDSPSD